MNEPQEDTHSFTLEKLKIAQQLQDLRIEVSLAGERIKVLTERVDSQVAVMRVSVDRHEHILVGNGHPGFVVRIDRLEQFTSAVKWLWTTIAALIISQVYEVFFRHN